MPTKDAQYLHISTGTMIRFFLIVVGVAAIYLVRDTLIALFFAVIVASAIEPVIERLKAWHVPRILGVVLIYLGIGVVFFLLIYLVLPLLLEEFRTLSVGYPVLQEQIRKGVNEAGTLPFFPDIQLDPDALIGLPSQYLEKLGGGVISFVSMVFGGIFSFALITIFSFYLAAQERGIEAFLRLVMPLRHESYVINLWERSQRKLGRWFRSQMLLGAIVGILLAVPVTVIGAELLDDWDKKKRALMPE
ncbi:MAG: hypothetical protein Greene071436_364 [Parcubacteria group bacterium Greene0714_36]|nr:MAG: hypothetical protein Greene071436_364 [Parcubacteria group bacterium Greene0714_36]